LENSVAKRNYEEEFRRRVGFIKDIVSRSTAEGIVYGNLGGKDSALVGILCKAACENTLSVIMPCVGESKEQNARDAQIIAEQFDIETRTVDITETKKSAIAALGEAVTLNDIADAHIAPRLRMTTLYAIAASERRLVAGTGNKSENFIGFFTKWGDGAYDFNPIADLTATEVYEFLEYLGAPQFIIDKAPTATVYDGETVEEGLKYRELDTYLLHGEVSEAVLEKIGILHAKSQHKREPSRTFKK